MASIQFIRLISTSIGHSIVPYPSSPSLFSSSILLLFYLTIKTFPFYHCLPVKWISQLHLSPPPIRLLFMMLCQLTFVPVVAVGQSFQQHPFLQPLLLQEARLFWSVVLQEGHFLMLRPLLTHVVCPLHIITPLLHPCTSLTTTSTTTRTL
jgi:hypothetical protein